MPDKTVKLAEPVYNRLDAFRGKRETFSQAVDRLLTLLDKVGELRGLLEGQTEFAHFQEEQLRKQAAAAAAKVPAAAGTET